MSFKLGNKNKPVGSITLGSGIKLFYRKLTTLEILQFELLIADFVDSIQQSYVKSLPLQDKLNQARNQFNDILSKEDGYQYSDEDSTRVNEYIAIVTELSREVTKTKLFKDPSCIQKVQEGIVDFIVTSEGIYDSDDNEHKFQDLSDENKLEVLESMTIEELNSLCDSLIKSSGLSPLE